jgi:hypothetical protein
MGKERTKSAHQLPLTGDNIGGVSSSSFFFFFFSFSFYYLFKKKMVLLFCEDAIAFICQFD